VPRDESRLASGPKALSRVRHGGDALRGEGGAPSPSSARAGAGKTTTLNVVAGFIEPEGGEILVNEREVTRLDPRLRGIGMVFQDYALFPTMDVFGNVAFGLGARGWGRDEAGKRVRELLALVRLERHERPEGDGALGRRAAEGGTRQGPRPEAGPAPARRASQRPRRPSQEGAQGGDTADPADLGVTTVYVTHDQEEALALSDKVAVMREGRSSRREPPVEIYAGPRPPSSPVRRHREPDPGEGRRPARQVSRARHGARGARGARPRFAQSRRRGFPAVQARGVRPGEGRGARGGGRGGARGQGTGRRTPGNGPRGNGPNRIDCTVRRCEYLGDGTLLEVMPVPGPRTASSPRRCLGS